MKKYKLLLFLLLSLFACNEEDSLFETSTDGLKLEYKSVPGGAMLKYILPNNRDIFSMNIRYLDNNGSSILKSCGYGGDSILLDGFTKGQKAIAQISFLNNYGKESNSFDFEFNTDDSAPWTFFKDLKVETAWDGFQVIYGSTSIATGIAHVFYLGNNPLTQRPDTILVKSFPINAKGDTLFFVPKQVSETHTIVVRTEDFAGYRVRQEIYPNVKSFITEKMVVTEDDFNDGGLSDENHTCKTGVKYLFDGDLKGRPRMFAAIPPAKAPQEVFGVYLAGPQAFDEKDPHPFIIEMEGGKSPAKIRLYALYRMGRLFPPYGENYAQGLMWNGFIDDKVPCKAVVYGTNNLDNKEEWVKLGTLNEDPKAEIPWYYPEGTRDATSLEELDNSDPIFVEIHFPPSDTPYRYLILTINDTFDIPRQVINYNPNKYITLAELEVYVKKTNL